MKETTLDWSPEKRNADFYGAFAVRLDSLVREFYPGLTPAAVGTWKHDQWCPQYLGLSGKELCTCKPEIELTIRLVKPSSKAT